MDKYFFLSKVNSSVRKVYILRPNRDQLQKMQLQLSNSNGCELNQRPPWISRPTLYRARATEAVAVSLSASSELYIGGNAGEV